MPTAFGRSAVQHGKNFADTKEQWPYHPFNVFPLEIPPPRSRGGDNSPANVVVACAPCNYGRRKLMLDEVGVIDPRTLPVLRTSWDGLERFLSAV